MGEFYYAASSWQATPDCGPGAYVDAEWPVSVTILAYVIALAAVRRGFRFRLSAIFTIIALLSIVLAYYFHIQAPTNP